MPTLFQHKHAELYGEKSVAKTTTRLKIKVQSSEAVRTKPRQALCTACTKKERELKPQSNSKSEENFERKTMTLCVWRIENKYFDVFRHKRNQFITFRARNLKASGFDRTLIFFNGTAGGFSMNIYFYKHGEV